MNTHTSANRLPVPYIPAGLPARYVPPFVPGNRVYETPVAGYDVNPAVGTLVSVDYVTGWGRVEFPADNRTHLYRLRYLTTVTSAN